MGNSFKPDIWATLSKGELDLNRQGGKTLALENENSNGRTKNTASRIEAKRIQRGGDKRRYQVSRKTAYKWKDPLTPTNPDLGQLSD